ncbi:restriction endonuclease [Helicobacter sp. 11S03491-1]|nr:restriction endonuclease [Helicobacter sp. 11S03491-1]
MKSHKDSLFFDETKLTYFERKEKLLKLLKGKATPYKRYCVSPIRYGGGKSLAVGFIIEHFPDDLDRVISPFMGGGSIEIACALDLGLEVKAFDIFDILVNFWQVLLQDSGRLYEALNQLQPTKDVYQQIKTELKNHWNKEIVLDPMRLARDYYFNFNLSYGPGFLGWMSSIYEDKNRYLKALEKIKDFYLPRLSVECASFEIAFQKYPNDFFYLDPPYFLDGDSKMFKGIYPQRNFPIHHNGFDHQLLAGLLQKHNGKFILSYNDCQWVRETYKDFKILEPKWQYTMGQGETRIGKNRIQRGDTHNIKTSHELLIIKE